MNELKIIKKYYGEKMMHFCRNYFSTLLENYPGKLSEIMLNKFETNKFLYNDIVEENLEIQFINFILGFTYEPNEETEDIFKTPDELLNEAGYTLYECKTEEEIEKFKKYYASNEILCTFGSNRLNRCHVFFALKDNALDLNREEFTNPKRQDEYGISVISIQFTKDPSHTLSIKNRYNHTVNNPDATFSNNLDNIARGLTKSFEKYYNLKQQYIQNAFEIPGYVMANDGKYYKYNYEDGNIYYCPNNIIIDNFKVKKYEKEKYLVMDYFVLDLVNKKIKLYNSNLNDDFVNGFNDVKKIKIVNSETQLGKMVIITPEIGEDVIINLDARMRIIGVTNNNLKSINDNYLHLNRCLTQIRLDSVELINKNFLLFNEKLKSLKLPNLKTIGSNCLFYNNKLENIEIPNINIIGDTFLYNNNTLESFKAENLKEMGQFCLYNDQNLKDLYVPNLKNVGISSITFKSLRSGIKIH